MEMAEWNDCDSITCILSHKCCHHTILTGLLVYVACCTSWTVSAISHYNYDDDDDDVSKQNTTTNPTISSNST